MNCQRSMGFIAVFALSLGASPAAGEPSTTADASGLIDIACARYALQPAAILTRNLWDPSSNSEATPATATAPAARQPFGLVESTYWIVNAAAGSDLDNSHLARLGGGISHFIADDISLDVELDLGYFAEQSDSAFGVNLNLLFRWHFFMSDDRSWSIYADGGAGMLGTTDDVPDTGSQFNFTPQAGLGVSFDVGEVSRMFLGVRWLHVSNARTYEHNPGEDFGMLYAMLSWPF